jgi:hypothetical protein
MNSILWINSLFILVILITALINSKEMMILNLGITLVVFLTMLFFNMSTNFVTLLISILGYGSILTLYAFFTGSTIETQLGFIKIHIFQSISLILVWLLVAHIKRIIDEMEILKARVSELEKFDTYPNLLSMNEFLHQAQISLIGMKRRKESGYLIKIRTEAGSNTYLSAFKTFLTVCLETVRNGFDLVTKEQEESIFVFLQNTNEDGCHIVIKRIKDNLSPYFNTVDVPFSFEFIEIDTIESAMDELHHGRKVQ